MQTGSCFCEPQTLFFWTLHIVISCKGEKSISSSVWLGGLVLVWGFRLFFEGWGFCGCVLLLLEVYRCFLLLISVFVWVLVGFFFTFEEY